MQKVSIRLTDILSSRKMKKNNTKIHKLKLVAIIVANINCNSAIVTNYSCNIQYHCAYA